MLKEYLQGKTASQSNYQYDFKEIIDFEIATATLVRYAPTTTKARYYLCCILEKVFSTTSFHQLELWLLINLLSNYYDTCFITDGKSNMNDALEFVLVKRERKKKFN